MEYTIATSCRQCAYAQAVFASSTRDVTAALRDQGWEIPTDDSRGLCPTCAHPAPPPPRPHELASRRTKPGDYAWSAVYLARILPDGGFITSDAQHQIRAGANFCTIEAMPAEEWPDGADLCARIHYILGHANRTSQPGQPLTGPDLHAQDHGLAWLTNYLADKGFRANRSATHNGRQHLIVYRLPAPE